MQIAKDKVVSLTYELHRDNEKGELIEMVNADHPFVFLFGAGGLIPEFESNLEGKEAGTAFEFRIESGNAYGEQDEAAFEYVPKDIFVIDGVLAEDLLQIGKFIHLRDQNGQLVRAKVAEVTEGEVLLDFNHPLAGQDLFFRGQVVDVRDATEEEIEHGHVHGPDGHHHH